MTKNSLSTSQVDLHDEIYLAVRFLSLHKVSSRTLSDKYHISSKSWAKVYAGSKISDSLHEFLFKVVMTELDLLRRLGDADVIRVMAEVGRVHAGLPHDEEIWRYILTK